MVTEYLISELAQPLYFHADTFCIGGASWALVHSMKAVYCNMKLTNKFIQLLSNILAYKNRHVCTFFCKVLSVVFKASSTILSLSKEPLIIRIVHGRTSYDILLLPLPPISRTSWKFFISLSRILFNGIQIDSFAFFLLASIIMQLESVLNSLYSHTRKPIHYTFCVSHS